MHHRRVWSIGLVLLVATAARAHDAGHCVPVVIDSDLGLDDVVALAMALQSPRVDLAAVVACEGVAGREESVQYLERMLDLFNRRDIPLYAAAEAERERTPPSFRSFAEKAVSSVLRQEATPFHRPFAPDAYVSRGEKVIVLVLGPLTNLAAALKEKPQICEGIRRVIIAGAADPVSSWNISYDPEALSVVQASRIALTFIVSDSGGRKPESWRDGELSIGQGTSIGEGFFRRLLADPRVRKHYTEQLASFHDELAFLYIVDPTSFEGQRERNTFGPTDCHTITQLLVRSLSYGRQQKARVVFADCPFPDNVLEADVRERKVHLIANNGEDEWFAQLLTNELHEHLGAYSVIGAKMGLRAAELLNAPQHALKVLSHTDACPPISCMNDGIIVATGSTPGRGLFDHVAGPPGSTNVTFDYNGRQITLALKGEFQKKIRQEFSKFREKVPLEHREYWDEVRRLGLDIWENWHRRNLFEIVEFPPQ